MTYAATNAAAGQSAAAPIGGRGPRRPPSTTPSPAPAHPRAAGTDTEFATLQLASDRLTPTSPEPLISFVVPAYNEASSLQDVLQRVYTLPLRAEVIAVDDGSTDRTAEILERFAESHGLIVIRHERNRGKGAAVRTGIARSTGEVVLIQDADMEYDPSDVPELIRPIVEGYAEEVYGSRLTGRRPPRADLLRDPLGKPPPPPLPQRAPDNPPAGK